jgi:hypothetical protein
MLRNRQDTVKDTAESKISANTKKQSCIQNSETFRTWLFCLTQIILHVHNNQFTQVKIWYFSKYKNLCGLSHKFSAFWKFSEPIYTLGNSTNLVTHTSCILLYDWWRVYKVQKPFRQNNCKLQHFYQKTLGNGNIKWQPVGTSHCVLQ